MIFNVSQDKKWLVLDESSLKDELDRRQLEISLTKKIKNYFFHPLVKKKIWNGDVTFLYKGKFVPIGLWNELIGIGKDHDLDIEINGLDVIVNEEVTLEDITEFAVEFFKDHPTHKPRDYQIEAAWKIIKYKLSISELATSSGKTLVVFLVIAYLKHKKLLGKFLMIVPNTNLVMQATEDFQDYGAYRLGFKFQQIHGGVDGIREEADIVIGTYQSLVKKDKEFLEKFTTVCVDEAHQTQAMSIKKILGMCANTLWRFGLTGTFTGEGSADYFTIQANLGPLIMKISPDFLFKNDFATPIDIKIVRMNYIDDEKKKILYTLRNNKVDKDGNALFIQEKKLVVANKKRLEFICDFIGKTTKNSLVLFQSVAEGYGKAIYDRLRDMYPDKEVYYVDGDTSPDLRDEYKGRLESQNNRILVASFGTFSTGISIKNIHNIFLTESYKSEILIGQSLGRMMRLLAGKTMAIVIDFVDDFSWNGKLNYLMKHSEERILYYKKQKFPYTIYEVDFRTNILI